MRKLVLKLDMHDDKCRPKAMKMVSQLPGVDSVSFDMKGQLLTVIGDPDPVTTVGKLRKVCDTKIVSVGPAKEPEKKKEEPKKEEPKKEEPKKAEESIQDPNTAELLAIKYAMESFLKAERKEKVLLIIESHSTSAVKWIKDYDSRPKKLWPMLKDIDTYISQIGTVVFKIIQTEVNDIEDSLAKDEVVRSYKFCGLW